METSSPTRKSFAGLGEIYFRTATIHQWLPLLAPDKNKQLIIYYLNFAIF
jgi:hypothetical protein